MTLVVNRIKLSATSGKNIFVTMMNTANDKPPWIARNILFVLMN